MSDHYATITELDAPQLPPIPPPPPRWNQDLANWVVFRLALEEWAAHYVPPEDIDQLEKDLVEAIHHAADMAMPKKSRSNHTYKDSWYYSPEVRRLKTMLNRVKKLYRKRPSMENRELLQTVKNDVHQQLQDIRIAKWMEWCSQLSQYTKLSELWKWLRRVAGKKSTTAATHPHPLEEAERLAASFASRTSSENLSPETRGVQEQLAPGRWEEINEACLIPDDTDAPYTPEELQAVHKVGKDTAPGADKITYTMIKYMGPAGETALLRIINKTHIEQTRPVTWNQQDTQPIPKPKDPQNPRPIALVSCLEKTAEKMVLNRLKYKVGPLHKHLYAYQEGIGTTECITDVLSFINGKEATVVFIDYEKAFELASPTAILQSLKKKGVQGHLLAWNKNYVLGRQARVKFQGIISSYHDPNNGTPQGGLLSPFLLTSLWRT